MDNNIDIKRNYSEYYLRLKNMGYDDIELRKMASNYKEDFHFHPFTASMIIIDGNVIIDDQEKIHKLKKGDFISVNALVKHNEKTDSNGATFLYAKKYKTTDYNFDLVGLWLEEFYMVDKSWPLVAYIRRSSASFLIYLILFQQYYTEIWLSQEEVLSKIPKRYGSRSTLINIINDGLERKNIFKNITFADKRSVYYILGKDVFTEMSKWLGTRHELMQKIVK
jgi:hypothetical protein